MTVNPSNENEKLVASARERFQNLINSGSHRIGVSDSIDPYTPPEWFDREKFDRSQKLADKYFLSMSYSSSIGLLLGIQVPIFLEPLLTTGNHRNIPKLYRRYLSTGLHVYNWYTHDPFLKDSPSYKSIHQVRSMHKKICDSMNKNTGKMIGVDKLWVSQCDMAMTQWAFFALLILYPKDCGAHAMSQDDLEHIIYLWRVLGYLMGIEDEFNLSQGTFEECKVLYKVILDEFIRPKLSVTPHPYQIGYDVSHGIAKALRAVNPEIRFNVLLHHWYKVLNIPFEIPLTFVHQLRLKSVQFALYTTLRSPLFYSMANNAQKKRLNAHKKKKEKVEKQLMKKYPDTVFESKCPFSVELDYSDVFGVKQTEISTDIDNNNKPITDQNDNNNITPVVA